MLTLICVPWHVSSPEICAADSSLGTGSPMGQDSLFMSKVCLPEESGRSMLGPALRMLAGTRSPRMPTIVWKGARHCTEGVPGLREIALKLWRRLRDRVAPFHTPWQQRRQQTLAFLENDRRPGDHVWLAYLFIPFFREWISFIRTIDFKLKYFNTHVLANF